MVDLKDEFPDLFPEEEPVVLLGQAENKRLRQVTSWMHSELDMSDEDLTPDFVLSVMTATWAVLEPKYQLVALELFSDSGFLANIGVPGFGAFSEILGVFLHLCLEKSKISKVAGESIIESGYESQDDCFLYTNVRLPVEYNTYNPSNTVHYPEFTLTGDFERTEEDIILIPDDLIEAVRDDASALGIAPDVLLSVMSNVWLNLDNEPLMELFITLCNRMGTENYPGDVALITTFIAIALDGYADPELADDHYGLVLDKDFYDIADANEVYSDCYYGTTVSIDIERTPNQSANTQEEIS